MTYPNKMMHRDDHAANNIEAYWIGPDPITNNMDAGKLIKTVLK